VSNWTAGQAAHFGIRGITVNAVAAGRSVGPGYDGIAGTSPSVAAELTRLALFLTTPSARHITGQTLHVSHGSLANFG
jgi:NAD(P)-dependent dehydrogenase (short-subunit alcohol dehydrogenase family)